ncbi:MAG: bifunctional oligoribonuclease/PAP phosphatase NrnA [Armatimonadetes bacterium]|nr:bifunctional oligoribonuclease/PAP phosphatase NrnA [Armatimonadota bacterium]
METDRRLAVRQLKKAVDEAQRILIAAHVNPDGDTIGAALALAHGLALGKEVVAVCSDPVPANLRFLPGWEKIISAKESPDAIKQLGEQEFDLAIIVDLSAATRLGGVQTLVEDAKQLAIVDHHEAAGLVPDGIHVGWPDYAATCLILHEVLAHLGVPITSKIAQCLLAGIATDTGNFKFRNTDPKALRAAADLLEMGGDITQINEEIWDRKPLPALKLLARALSNLRLSAKGRVVISCLSLQDYKDSGASEEHSENIVNAVGSVKTAQVFALFREGKGGKVRVSLRSHGDVDVARICSRYDGGGHINAAGCTFESTLESAMETLVPVLERAVRARKSRAKKSGGGPSAIVRRPPTVDRRRGAFSG